MALKHGGKREGAGRKPRPEPLKAFTLKVEPELLKRWNARKKREKLSGPKLLDKLLDEPKARWAKEKREK